MGGYERGIAEVFASLEGWLVSTGATESMLRLSWAVLTFLWLGHVAATMQPGRPPEVVGTFGRLLVAGGLLSAVGSLNAVIIRAFETLRDAGSAILLGLIGQNWTELVGQWVVPTFRALFQPQALWFSQRWAMVVLIIAILFGILLFAIGFMIYLAILFFAHLTLLLAIFLAPLALALLAAPGTARWTARWAAVIVRTGLVVFSVRVIHAAAIYLAVIVPVRQVSTGVQNGMGGLGGGGDLGGDLQAIGVLVWHVVSAIVLMIVGTGIGVYAMLRAERLTGQFIDGVAFSEGLFAWPLWIGSRLAAGANRSGSSGSESPSIGAAPVTRGGEPFGPPRSGAQEATVVMPAGRARS